jgi:pilus assembly protein Flp/PilA
MRQMAIILARLARNESGATAIEYGFIAFMISIAAVAAMTQIGLNVSELTGRVMEGFR